MDSERFEELLFRWRQGEATAGQLAELEALLKADPGRRRVLAESFLLEAHLYRAYAGRNALDDLRQEAGPQAPEAPRKPGGHRLERVAAILVFALTAGALAFLFLRPREGVQEAVPGRGRVHGATASKVPEADRGQLDRLLGKAGIDLAGAIRIALADVPGGSACEAHLEEEDGRAVFTIRIGQGRKIQEVQVDAGTGAVVRRRPAEGDPSGSLQPFKVPLGDIVETAVRRVAGTPFQVELEEEGGRTRGKVKILHAGRVSLVWLDTQSGEVVRVQEAGGKPGEKGQQGNFEGQHQDQKGKKQKGDQQNED